MNGSDLGILLNKMKYYITVSDKNFTQVAEKLFESLKTYSNYKIIYFTVNFEYKNKYSNVIPIFYKTKFKESFAFNEEKNILNYDNETRANLMFVKSSICNKALEMSNDTFCYVDADCIAVENCDEIFEQSKKITNYPLLNENCHQFMIYNGKGDPFLQDGRKDLNFCLEANLMKKLTIPVEKRTDLYRQANVILFNRKCNDIMKEWETECYKSYMTSEPEKYAPFMDETVINCLLWKYDYYENLGQVSINIPSVDDNKDFVKPEALDSFINTYKNPKDDETFCGTFCKIPSKNNINKIKFLHGKVSYDQFDYINKKINTKMSKQQDENASDLLYIVHSSSVGDTIASTPVLRKLYNSYSRKIDIVTFHPEIFAKNKYVNRIFSYEKFNLNNHVYKQKFESFLGIGGIKNNLGVEKKHNTIDIRQFHAIDLGFMLHENEMEYDYSPDNYINIQNLPQNYVCIHASNTWPSRTYSDDKFQELINLLNDDGIPVVLVGKNAIEYGFHVVDKKTKKLNIKIGLDLTNKLSLSQCWHVINKSNYFITMDSGLLHLAGTTDTNIIQLGSSINNKLRAPYRNGSQDYKYKYISGSCNIFCASDVKYGVKEWGTIQGIPPLINCLENKSSFECHPSPKDIFNYIVPNVDKKVKDEIEVFKIERENCVVHYRSLNGDIGICYIQVFDEQTKTFLYKSNIEVKGGIDYWTAVGNPSKVITNDIKVVFWKEEKIFFEKVFKLYPQDRITEVSHLKFNYDLGASNLYEIYINKDYEKHDIKIEANDIVVDVGSNLSTFIHYALNKNASKVYSCEPTRTCLEIINRYFKDNPKVVINDVAISDVNGEAFIDILEEAGGGNKLSNLEVNDQTLYKNCKKEKVKTITFKTFLEKNNIAKIDFLKLDCEGGELFVFVEENKEFFKNNVNKIALEYHNNEKDNIISYLNSLNYQVFSVDRSNSTTTIGMIYAKNKNFSDKNTTLFIAPHLSTGGSPAYLKWLIEETMKKNIKPVVIEYCNYGSYDVHKKEIVNLVGKDNFYTFGNHWDSDFEYNKKSPELIKLIESINPSIIHLNEISEIFSLKGITPLLFNYLYSKDRAFKLIETSHTSEFNFDDKRYLPDQFDFCTEHHLEKSKNIDVFKNVVEMIIENKIRPERSETLKKIGLSHEYFHVLNVGLFTKGKNQKFLFELAERLQDKKVMFHFLGNTCYFDDCGITEKQKTLNNCVIWGERNDVDLFMSCMDLFVFPSLKELNPISIKEALSWNMPCYINNLETYGRKYDNNPLVNYIKDDNLFKLLNNLPYV